MTPPPITFPSSDFTDFDRFDALSKSSYERLRKSMRAKSSNEEDLGAALADTSRALERERRLAGFDPYQKILGNEWMPIYLNAKLRQFSVGNEGLSRNEKSVLKALGEDTSPGSNLIDDRVATELYDLLYAYGAWQTLGVIPLEGKTNKFAVLTGRPAAVFLLTEAGAMSDDATSTALQVTGDAEFIGAMLHISEQLLADAKTELTSAFLSHFEQAFNRRIEEAAFNGNGVADATNGGMTGIFQHADVPIVNAAAGNTTVQLLDRDDLVNTIAACDPPVLQRRPRWWIHPALLPPLMKVNDSSGYPVLQTQQEAGGDSVFSLLGFPLTITAGAPSTNGVSSKVIAFGDGRAMALGIRRQFALEASKHHRWNTLQRSFRGIGRARAEMRKGTGFAILRTAAV